MIELKPINSTDEFFNKLAENGNIQNLNEEKHLKAIDEVNTTMEETHRTFQDMDKQSQIAASTVVLTD